MARSAAQRSPRLLATLLATGLALAAFASAGAAFLPASPARGARARVRVEAMAASGAAFAVASPAFAEEAAKAEEGGLLNFGKVPLGGGFALNLDIPETGIVNIAVLIAGLLYLLAPLLSESMASREKEIQTDIDDAIVKFAEASERLAEAQKAQAQANEVTAEIEASIEKDKKDFEATIRAQTDATLKKQAAAAENALSDLQASAENKVEAFIQDESVSRGLKELSNLSQAQKAKFMEAAIASL